MAYAALVSLAQVVEQILPRVQLYFLLCGKKQLNSLHENLVFLQEFLENFPETGTQTIHNLESRIRDAAYQLEDIIESHISTPSDSMFETAKEKETHSEFKSCTEEVESIVAGAKKMKRNSKYEDLLHNRHDSSTVVTSRHAAVISKDDYKVALDDDLNQIRHRVNGHDTSLQIIPIVGMGGIGKTTLATAVYEDKSIKCRFDFRSWVTISQEYKVEDILLGILNSTELEHNNNTDEDVERLIVRVNQKLRGSRYLILLDDMWDGEAWDNVRRAFPEDDNGSRVILTTRLLEIAAYVDPYSPVHKMQLLDEGQSWALLRKKVFGKRRCPPKLKHIGEMIARNCKGLPLVIVVIAGLLKANKEPNYWEKVAIDVVNAAAATTSDDHDQFFGVLSLSYTNLPHHLRPCFLYMGVYPEDSEIYIRGLIKLWVAEGFLKPVGSESLEEVAEEYLQDLVERSLVTVAKKKASGRISTCRIHDVLRQLSLRKAQEEKFLIQHNFRDRYIDKVSNFPKTIKNQRRVVIHTDDIDSLEADNIPSSSVRSLRSFGNSSEKLLSFTSHFRLLKVVDNLLVNSKVFPLQIFELVHLRYLAFTYDYNGKCWIPAAISKLQNLQTLLVTKGSSGKHGTCQMFLPVEIWNLPQLRHLVLMTCTILLSDPDGDRHAVSGSVLENLQTLSRVQNFEFTDGAVERIQNLKKLGIHYCDFDHNKWSNFHLDNLLRLNHLEKLTFRFHAGNETINQYPLPKDISFPKNLKKITLIRSGIPWGKMSAIGSLQNLEVLKLRRDSFVGGKWETNKDEFPRLKCLAMVDLNLKIWNTESDHFPCLEQLSIFFCEKLKEVPRSIGDIPTLQKLSVGYCNKRAEESVKEIQEEQEGLGNDALQVHITYTEPYRPYRPAVYERVAADGRTVRVVRYCRGGIRYGPP